MPGETVEKRKWIRLRSKDVIITHGDDQVWNVYTTAFGCIIEYYKYIRRRTTMEKYIFVVS